MDLPQIKRLERNQAVFDGIVQITVFAFTAGGVTLPLM
jgi:hypothetical protein